MPEEKKEGTFMDGFNSEINKKPPPPRPFPYYPPVVSDEELKRLEVMNELNKWANNDPFMAKRSAETLILLIASQFDISLIKLDQ